MGGNLLTPIWGLPAKRLSRAQYEQLGALLVEKLEQFAPGRRFRVYRTFADKESFGDIDILCERVSGDNLDWLGFLRGLSGVAPHVNGNTISIPMEGFQCDFNFVGSGSYECAYCYMTAETGNFMGVIAQRMGLTYGHRGLYLKIPLQSLAPDLPANEYGEVFVSATPADIFDILGFDYERFERGFATFEDMARWVAASRYFQPGLFSFENLNSVNRTRNRKRPVYAQFVEWCVSQSPSNTPLPAKESVREKLIAERSRVADAVNVMSRRILKNAERRAKFNGHLVSEWLGVKGEALGAFIVDYKRSKGGFDTFLDSCCANEIRSDVEMFAASRIPLDASRKS